MKYIPYGRQSIDKGDIREVVKVLRSNWITQGPKIQEFENALTKYCDVKYAVAVSSGTAALHLACLTAGLKKGDEAITSPITFLATPNSVLYTGARPVFADIDYDTINIDPKQIEEKITKKTRAVLPVHFVGLPCDMEGIYTIAKKNNLIVIEDACHALGARYEANGKWVKVGSCIHSEMTVLSFHPVKHITTGEGGAILTNDKGFYEKLMILRNHGITRDKRKIKRLNKGNWYYEMQILGFNYRITDIQCALGLSQLKKLDKFLKRRREIADTYNKAFLGNPYFDLPQETKNSKSAWHLYAIRLKDKYKNRREEIFTRLKKESVGVQVHYIPVYLHPYYRELGFKAGLCPNAEDFYQREISIPLYYSLSTSDIKFLIQKIFKVFMKIR